MNCEMNSVVSTTHIIYLNVVPNLLLDNVNCCLLARSHRPKSLSLLQKKELMRSFLDNSKLTRDTMIKLSDRLGITHGQVKFFFRMRSTMPRNASIKAYSKLMQGKGFKVHLLNQTMHACLHLCVSFHIQCLHVCMV